MMTQRQNPFFFDETAVCCQGKVPLIISSLKCVTINVPVAELRGKLAVKNDVAAYFIVATPQSPGYIRLNSMDLGAHAGVSSVPSVGRSSHVLKHMLEVAGPKSSQTSQASLATRALAETNRLPVLAVKFSTESFGHLCCR